MGMAPAMKPKTVRNTHNMELPGVLTERNIITVADPHNIMEMEKINRRLPIQSDNVGMTAQPTIMATIATAMELLASARGHPNCSIMLGNKPVRPIQPPINREKRGLQSC